MMRGFIGGLMTGGVVSVLGLGAASVVSEPPAGVIPPAAPLVDAPMVNEVEPQDTTTAQETETDPSTPVGSVTIEAPVAPDLPDGEAPLAEPDAPVVGEPEAAAPRADTDPLDQPQVVSVEGAMAAPEAAGPISLITVPVDPVLPNPQSLPPQTPVSETDVRISTAPAPLLIQDPAAEVEVVVIDDDLADEATDDFVVADDVADGGINSDLPDGAEDTFVVDLGVGTDDTDDGTQDGPENFVLNTGSDDEDSSSAPLVQLGGENTLMADRGTGVTIRRPTDTVVEAAVTQDTTDTPGSALEMFATDAGDTSAGALLSIVLIDDGTMSSAPDALAGLPFDVTIAIDPSRPNASDTMASYRAEGFEVLVMAMLPEGAQPSDVEITFESVFSSFPESIGVLDIGTSGLQSDADVTEQAMDILAAQGRGFITVGQGLNMAQRAADQAGVQSAVVFRDLDGEGQDARVVRRFVDQAAFRARQESGVVLIGRVRPDTISALILWGTAGPEEQVSVVPVSAVLLAQDASE